MSQSSQKQKPSQKDDTRWHDELDADELRRELAEFRKDWKH